MTIENVFSPDDLAEIERRVGEAEASTGGEIVPYVVDACDPYPEAAWAATAVGALLAPLLAAGLHLGFGLWGGAWSLWLTVPALVGGGAGWLAGRFATPLRRLLVPAEVLERRVELRAAAAFMEEEVFATRERTGILLFVALFEHRMVVLADAGIHAAVGNEEWTGIAADTAAGIRAGHPGRALADAVTRCGELLARRVERRPDDVDELPDAVRREEM